MYTYKFSFQMFKIFLTLVMNINTSKKLYHNFHMSINLKNNFGYMLKYLYCRTIKNALLEIKHLIKIFTDKT